MRVVETIRRLPKWFPPEKPYQNLDNFNCFSYIFTTISVRILWLDLNERFPNQRVFSSGEIGQFGRVFVVSVILVGDELFQQPSGGSKRG